MDMFTVKMILATIFGLLFAYALVLRKKEKKDWVLADWVVAVCVFGGGTVVGEILFNHFFHLTGLI